MVLYSEPANYDWFLCQNIVYIKTNEKQSVSHCFLFTEMKANSLFVFYH